jgi:2-haloacid dehalogenase
LYALDEMMPGPIAGSVEILAELKTLGTPLYALTNFSAETSSSALLFRERQGN